MTEQSISEPPHGKNGRLRLLSAIGAVAVVAVLAGVYGIGHSRGNPADVACQPSVNAAAKLTPLVHGEVAALTLAQKPFQVPDVTFKDASGHDRKLDDWRGRTVLLNLWATWCVPCRKEMPALDALQGDLGGPNLEVVAVNIDQRDPEKPLKFLKDVGATHLAYYSDDTAHVYEDLKTAGKAFGMPTTVLVDHTGCEIGNMAGPAEWSSDDGVKLIQAMLGSSS